MVQLEFNLTSIVMLLQFILLVFFLYKLLYKPFFKATDERRNRIQQEFDNAEKIRLEAESMQKEAKSKLEEATQQSAIIIANAKKLTENFTIQEREKVKLQVEKMTKTALQEIENQKREAMQSITEKSVSLAVFLASKILEKQMDEKVQSDYLRNLLARMQESEGR